MNYYQIIGIVLILLGTALSYYGGHLQSTQNNAFQIQIANYVEDQNKKEIPILKALRIEGTNYNNYKVVVKNIGNQIATKVTLVFDEESTPNIFQSNLMSRIEEIPNNVEVKLDLNILSG